MKRKIYALIMMCAAHTSCATDTAYSEITDNKGKKIGTASYKQGTEGVVITLKLRGLKPGLHGMHFHDIGSCTDYQSDSEKPSRYDKAHGFLNPDGPHEGNLPNLIVMPDGSANVEIYTDMISLSGQNWKAQLLDENGSALIIHEKEDDYYSQPDGNAGMQVACGIIFPAKVDNEDE